MIYVKLSLKHPSTVILKTKMILRSLQNGYNWVKQMVQLITQICSEEEILILIVIFNTLTKHFIYKLYDTSNKLICMNSIGLLNF